MSKEQLTTSIVRLLLAAAVTGLIIFLMVIIPPSESNGQQPPDASTLVKDTVLVNARETISQFIEAKQKVEVAAALVDSNTKKAIQILAVLDEIKPQDHVVTKVRVFAPTRKDGSSSPPVAVERPGTITTIIFQACDYVYGGDTHRSIFPNYFTWKRSRGIKRKDYGTYQRDSMKFIKSKQ